MLRVAFRIALCIAVLGNASTVLGVGVRGTASIDNPPPSKLLRKNVQDHVPSLDALSSGFPVVSPGKASPPHHPPQSHAAPMGHKAPAVASHGNLNARHAVAAADSLLTAFGSLDKTLRVEHCLPASADKLVKDFESSVQPNPIKRGAPLKLESHAVLVGESLTSGKITVSITAFSMPVLSVPSGLCQQEKKFSVPMIGDVIVRGTKCPKLPGQTVDVSIELTVPESITAGLPVGVKIEASNQDGSDIMCEDTNFLT